MLFTQRMRRGSLLLFLTVLSGESAFALSHADATGNVSALTKLECCTVLAAAMQTNRYYDRRGRSVGKSVSQGGTTRYYDRQGRNTGKSVTRGNTTRFYDRQGRNSGRVSGKR